MHVTAREETDLSRHGLIHWCRRGDSQEYPDEDDGRSAGGRNALSLGVRALVLNRTAYADELILICTAAVILPSMSGTVVVCLVKRVFSYCPTGHGVRQYVL